MDWEAILLTAKLATIVSTILFLIGIPLAYWISFSGFRWRFLVEAVVALPLILPPTVLGYYVLVAISPKSFLGKLYTEVFGTTLPFSFQGLVIASVLYSFPFDRFVLYILGINLIRNIRLFPRCQMVNMQLPFIRVVGDWKPSVC